MKIVTKLFLALCLVSLGATLTANAQIRSDAQIRANIPYSFVVMTSGSERLLKNLVSKYINTCRIIDIYLWSMLGTSRGRENNSLLFGSTAFSFRLPVLNFVEYRFDHSGYFQKDPIYY
jgi:hypothetical protein